MLNRRAFLLSTSLLPTAPVAFGALGARKRIAAVVTEYRDNSHADVIVGKYLQGYRQNNKPPYPRSKIVSLYTGQVPKNDLSRERAKQFNVPIATSIPEALTLGTNELAVDGVLLIGEHGDYPLNEKGQKMYPRFQFFTEITDTFRKTGKSVPVFSDKHLSYSWDKAKRMVEISRELHFPFMAGSSAPVAYRKPLEDTPFGAEVRHAVAVGYGGIEAYGFHMLESLQCMVDRRKGGETGVAAVQCLEGGDVWSYLDKTPWAQKLFTESIARSGTRKPGEVRDLVKEPIVFLLRYRDGLEAAGFLMNGAVQDFTVALEIGGETKPLSLLMQLESGKPFGHFACLVANIELMFESGESTYPVERTLLTSGVLDFLMDSRFRGHKVTATPALDVRYQVDAKSHFCRTPYAAPMKNGPVVKS